MLLTTAITREVVAHHEAGHAVAYIRRGYGFRHVTLRPRGAGELGKVMPWRPRPMLTTHHAQVSAAGPLAELYFGTFHSEDAEEFDADDLRAAFHISARSTDLAGSSGSDLDGYKAAYGTGNAAWRQVAEEIADDWSAIEAVALALLRSPRALTHREVQAVALPLLN